MQIRQRSFLEQVAAVPRSAPDPVWYANSNFLSCLAIGNTERAESLMREKVEFCLGFRSDCADFLLNLLLRAWLLYPDRISPERKESIRQAALSNRYYGGHRKQYPMFYNSENHHMSWAVAEFLTAQLFPGERFTFDGRTSRAHYERSRFLIANWIDKRARWGYCEWNSSPYMGVNLMSLLNLADFSADPEIRSLASQAVTKLLADLAADSAGGGIWSAQARVYEPQVFSPYCQPAATGLMILLGAGDSRRLELTGGIGECVATTSYRPPAWLCRLAADTRAPLVNEERHRQESDLFYSCRSAFWRPPVEITNEEARQAFAPDSLVDVAVRTERTGDYLVSAALLPPGHGAGKVDSQALYAIGCLAGRVPIFTTQPPVAAEARAEGQYWAGSGSVPRCFVQDGILAAVYAGGAKAREMTHAYFPTPDLDAWERKADWFLGRLGNAYVGVRAPDGASLTGEGPWAGREIRAAGGRAAWLLVFGSAERDGSFSAFSERCTRGIAVTVAEDRAAIEWTAVGAPIRVSHADGVTVGGQPFSCADWPQLRNAVVRSDYGSPVTRITPPGEAASSLDFSSARRICAEWERAD